MQPIPTRQSNLDIIDCFLSPLSARLPSKEGIIITMGKKIKTNVKRLRSKTLRELYALKRNINAVIEEKKGGRKF